MYIFNMQEFQSKTIETVNTYLLLAECEVHIASYELSFSFLLWPKHEARAVHENKEGKNEDP